MSQFRSYIINILIRHQTCYWQFKNLFDSIFSRYNSKSTFLFSNQINCFCHILWICTDNYNIVGIMCNRRSESPSFEMESFDKTICQIISTISVYNSYFNDVLIQIRLNDLILYQKSLFWFSCNQITIVCLNNKDIGGFIHQGTDIIHFHYHIKVFRTDFIQIKGVL